MPRVGELCPSNIVRLLLTVVIVVTLVMQHFGMSANAIARMSRFHLTSKGVESSLRSTIGMLKKTVGENSRAL
jgi:hypothetical protein